MVKRYLLIFYLSVHVISLFAQDFKVVGYLPFYRFDIIDEIDFAKITHLNLAFVNPDINGNLSVGNQDIYPIVSQAISDNPALKVFISLGGGSLTPEWSEAYDKFLKPEYRSEFIRILIEYVQLHRLDGIDVDLEWSHVNEYYSPFVIELRDSLKSHGKGITAALPAMYRYPDLTQGALNAFDFINLMAYDKTGPWRPNDPGPHSPESFAIESISFWRNQGVGDEKMTLGVPFYGYDFTDQNNITSFTFGSIVAEDENLAFKDQDSDRYYNGIPTIQSKTYYALNQVSGIMIWELGQDDFGEYSLLSAIDYVVKTKSLPITAVEDNLIVDSKKFDVYPNPFQDEIKISIHGKINQFKVRLMDLQGREINHGEFNFSGDDKSIDMSGVPNGIYVLQMEFSGKNHRKILLKN